MQKRHRACEACHLIKVRCEPCEDSADSCGRCTRAGKECVPTPRRLQRDRIAELEAQVQELTNALQAQSLASEIDTKKRKLNNDSRVPSARGMNPVQGTGADLAFIDGRVSLELQQRVLDVYSQQYGGALPLVHVEPLELDDLRRRVPVLLLSILAFPTNGVLPLEVQSDLVDKAMQDFASRLIAAGERSLELAQALLVAGFWWRSKPDSKHATVLQIVQLSTSMAIDIGFAGAHATHDPAMYFERSDQDLSIEGCRTWLSCFVASSAMTTVMRRPDANPWTPHHDASLAFLNAHATTAAQRTFCEVIQAEILCYRAVTRLGLCDTSRPTLLTSDKTKASVSRMQRDIESWITQLPAELKRPELLLWRHVALIYLNEPVLHTGTNKATFSAPYIPERIAAADFANPTVTVDHVAALYALKDSCHVALDIASGLKASVLLAASSLFYTPRILYSLMMMAKLYVAVTAPGNTYGAVLNRHELRLQHYFDKLRVLTIAMRATDATSFNTMIIGAFQGIEDWYGSYSMIVEQYERDAASHGDGSTVYLEPFDFTADLELLEADPKLLGGESLYWR